MDAIFEKAIDLKHKNFKIVEWVVPQIESDSDYTEKELAQSIEFLKNKNLIDYKNIRFKSYKEWGFPKWKRAKLNGYDPKKYICLLYTSPSPRDRQKYRMPSSA